MLTIRRLGGAMIVGGIVWIGIIFVVMRACDAS